MKKYEGHNWDLFNFEVKGETLNRLYAEGFRYYVKGNYRFVNAKDPWTGMTDYTYDWFLFENKKEAEKYAVTQLHPYNAQIHSKVNTIPAYTKTYEEIQVEEEEKKKIAKEKKLAKDLQKASEMGLTLEEYKKYKYLEKKIKWAKNRNKELEREIEENNKKIEENEKFLKKMLDK